jgi:hypothetical protein
MREPGFAHVSNRLRPLAAGAIAALRPVLCELYEKRHFGPFSQAGLRPGFA